MFFKFFFQNMTIYITEWEKSCRKRCAKILCVAFSVFADTSYFLFCGVIKGVGYGKKTYFYGYGFIFFDNVL